MSKLLALALIIPISACSIGPDKYLHMAGGSVVALAGKTAGLTDRQTCVASLAVGIAKEVIDPVFSIPDVFATAIVCVPLLLNEK